MKLLAATVLLLAAPLGTWAQHQEPEPESEPEQMTEGHVIQRKSTKPWLPVPGKVYVYVEQMPELPSGSGQWRIVAEIVKRVHLPAGSVKPARNPVFVYFEVSRTGLVQHPRITKSSGSVVVDAAVLRAVCSLLRLRPGRQAGRPAMVSLTLPVRLATSQLPGKTTP